MKEEYTEYLLGLGMTKPLIDRVEVLLDIYSRLTQWEVDDIYISEYIKEDGRQEYEDLRIYSGNSYALCQNFLTSNAITLSDHRRISHIYLDRDNYDLSEAEEKSKMTIVCSYFGTDSKMTMKATGLNCNKLTEIFLKYLQPHIVSI